MDIKKTGSQASGKGPAEYFTATVRVDPNLFNPDFWTTVHWRR